MHVNILTILLKSSIILRYQINIAEGKSARSELLEWVRSKIPEYNIQNFAKDWNDGKAVYFQK